MKKFLKNNLGIATSDGVIAVIVIALFSGLIVTVSYNIYLASTSAKRNAKATQYMVSIFETVDGMNYNNVTRR